MAKKYQDGTKIAMAVLDAAGTTPEATKATLVLVVDFETTVERDDVERIMDEARAHGGIRVAAYCVQKPYVELL